jgi:tricorn protease
LTFFCLVLGPALLTAIDTKDTRLLTQPAVSRDRIAFVYANDLWTADLKGENVRRLTTDIGVELNPVFSPDGTSLAFSGQYDGNIDVYVISASGGVPQRLTGIRPGPGPDCPRGKAIPRRPNSYSGRYWRLPVPIEGGFPEQLKIPYANRAALSPEGTRIAYNPLYDAFTQWKNYRGGTNSVIWIVKLSDYSLEKVPQPAGRSNDPGPMWIGDKLYFRSDRNGEFNLFSYDMRAKEVEQLTFFKDYPVLNASAGGGRIIFEQAGRLHLFDPERNTSAPLTIGIAADLAELRERFAKGVRWVRGADLSPSGARAVLEFRGEIVTIPAEKGDPRNLTGTVSVHERSPIWSLDGKSIAYLSDASGEYELHVRAQDGKGPAKAFPLAGSGFYDSPAWSPDGSRIFLADNSRTVFLIDVATGKVKKIAADYQLGGRGFSTSWSPDSKWLVYTLNSATYIQKVYAYSVDQDKSFPSRTGSARSASRSRRREIPLFRFDRCRPGQAVVRFVERRHETNQLDLLRRSRQGRTQSAGQGKR